MDRRIIEPYVNKFFRDEMLPSLVKFVAIPNCSPSYDETWDTNGYQIQAAKYVYDWVKKQNLKGCNPYILKEQGRTPFLYIDIAATKKDDNRTFLMYGHMDKQPPLTDLWSPGLGPYQPVIKDGQLYGRGAADDGYAVFTAVTAVKCCQDNNWPLPRIVIIVEAAEESNTIDLTYYLKQLNSLIGKPNLIICLDSGAQDFKRLWLGTSLRGVISFNLKVSLLKRGFHSGNGGGFVADSFLVLRTLLDRLEDSETGEVLLDALKTEIPKNRQDEIDQLSKMITLKDFLDGIKFYDKTTPISDKINELIINNTWKPTITITGAEGLPEPQIAGNVLREFTQVKVSVRLPPLVDSQKALASIKQTLTTNVPYNAKVEVANETNSDGWNLTQYSKKLDTIFNDASNKFFGQDRGVFGIGGSIPFVEFFSTEFPDADIVCTGVTHTTSNIHAPDEHLNLDFCRTVTCCLAYLISDY
jgi:acetylornithine deacetylase/succinyl-diaminopimelate desuccinylase-like protein